MSLDARASAALRALGRRSALGDGVIWGLAEVLPFLAGAAWALWALSSFGAWPFARLVALSAGAGLLARGVLVELLSRFVRRERPYVALGFEPLLVPWDRDSFPSGHTAALSAAAAVAWAYHPAWALGLVGASAVVGAARVAAGVHYASDVLVGILAGGFSGWLVLRLFGTV